MIFSKVDVETTKTYTFTELTMYAERFAAGLLKRGVGKGDRICLFLTNCIELPIMWYSCWSLGATLVLGISDLTAGLLTQVLYSGFFLFSYTFSE